MYTKIDLVFPGSSEIKFESFFKFSMKSFVYISILVEDEMSSNSVKYTDLNGKLLNHNDRVAIALRRLSSGESLTATRDLLSIHPTTVSSITWRFVQAMEKKSLHHLRWPNSTKNLKEKFESIRGLPNCCGAIAYTKIMITCPSSKVDPYRDMWCHKQNNASMIVQAIVDPEMRFLDIVSGFPGSFSDADVLQSSCFYELSEQGKRLNGEKISLSKEVELREYIVGHQGLPLLPWLLTPFNGNKLSETKRSYNDRHNATWKVAANALAKLKEDWGIIQGVMWRPDKDKLPRIILVCCLLHNILIDLEDGISFSGKNEQEECQEPFKNSRNKAASAQRDNLALYLSANLPS